MPEHDRQIVRVVRDHRRRPRVTWREGWAASRNHDLSTLSTWGYIRDAVELGGLRAVAPALTAYAAGAALVVVAAFGAALLAAAADGSTSRAWSIILLSVILSQAITFLQSRKLPRRAVIAAYERVQTMPRGVHRVYIEVKAKEAADLARSLLARGALYVEQFYYLDSDAATLVAFVDRSMGHAHAQAAAALGAAWHKLGNIVTDAET